MPVSEITHFFETGAWRSPGRVRQADHFEPAGEEVSTLAEMPTRRQHEAVVRKLVEMRDTREETRSIEPTSKTALKAAPSDEQAEHAAMVVAAGVPS
jgi:hypothetical protein